MKFFPSFPSTKLRRGFTIVELVVAMSVLVMMTLFLTQMFNSVNQTWLGGQARVDNFSKGRVLMDLVCEDLKNGIYRSDLAAFPGTAVAFYTRRPGFSTGATNLRDVALVSYSLDPTGILKRGDLAMSWTSAATEISFGNSAALPREVDAILRDTSPGVVAFRVLFVGRNGSLTATPPPPGELKGFAVGLVVVDGQTMNKLTATQVEELQTSLAAAVTGTEAMREEWEEFLRNGITWATYPKALPASIKIFERYVSLP